MPSNFKIGRVSNRIILFLSLIAYASVLISPQDLWFAGFVTFSIPLFLIYHTLFLVYFLFRKKFKSAILPLIFLGIAYPFLLASFSIHLPDFKEKGGDFSIMSYNVRIFNVYEQGNENYLTSKNVIQWVKNDDAEIKCLQEFYNENDNKIFNCSEKISQEGLYHYYVETGSKLNSENGFGLAIFSKFPILKKGEVHFKKKTQNQAIFVDVKIDDEIFRIYNVHLESMNIDKNYLKGFKAFWYYAEEFLQRLKYGMQTRAMQVETLISHIEACPHQNIILCGDLNAPPYSYPYFSLQQKLNNAFEKAGNGFGFSFNHPALFFLRIDNQFFSPTLKIHTYQTHREIYFSDHFPIKASYSIK